MNGLLPVLAAAVSIGLGCGTCCSPVVSAFLSSYVISHGNGAKHGIKYFMVFYAGKMIAVTALCIISSILGVRFVSEAGYIGSINLRLIAQIGMSTMGIYMLIKFLLERKGSSSCAGCKACGEKEKEVGKKYIPLLFAGFAYGVTPCAPMLIILGYAFTLPVMTAFVAGIIFSLATMLSPILMVSILTGALSPRLRKEVPQFISVFKVLSYVVLIVMPYFARL